MKTKYLERIALGVLAVLCVVLAAAALRPDPKPAAPDGSSDALPTEPLPQEDGAQPGEPAASQAPVSAGQTAQADAASPASAPGQSGAQSSVQGSAPQSGGEDRISVEDARTAALTHAGLAAGDVTFTRQELEWEDGRQVYDVEFYAGGREYDYEIDAATGEIVKFDYDAESWDLSAGDGEITRERAQEIALGKVPGASAADVKKLKLDYDDGRPVYEVEIRYDGMEYDLEIKAADGTILEFESESIYD